MTNDRQSLMNLRCPPGIGVIDDIVEGHQRYQALLAALDLGLFEFLDTKDGGDGDEIAAGTGINGAFVRDFLNVLVDAGLVARDGERYRNAPAAKAFLLPESPFHQGDVVRNLTRNSSWSDLSAALLRKEPWQGAAGATTTGPGAAFIAALGQKALRGELQAVTAAIAAWRGFGNARRILDVGGGHGLYTIALCQANPHLKGTVLDQAGVVETTRRYVAGHGLADRITVEVGDVRAGALGAGYDIVLISHLLYKFRENLRPIFDAVHGCLEPGGLFVSNHWFCATDCLPGASAVQGLSKALQSFGHPLCREDEFDRLFTGTGFEIVAMGSALTTFGQTRVQLAEKRGVRTTRSQAGTMPRGADAATDGAAG